MGFRGTVGPRMRHSIVQHELAAQTKIFLEIAPLSSPMVLSSVMTLKRPEAGGFCHRLARTCQGDMVIGVRVGRGKQPEGVMIPTHQEVQVPCQRWFENLNLVLSSLSLKA